MKVAQVVKRSYKYAFRYSSQSGVNAEATGAQFLPYPFQDSFRGKEMLEDPRFSMYKAIQPLNKFESDHITNIMDSVLSGITHHNSSHFLKENTVWVDTGLQTRLTQLRKILKERDLQLTIARAQQQAQLSSSGFLLVQGLQYPPKQQMHELDITRQGQLLKCNLRDLPKPPKEESEDIRDSIKQSLNKTSKEVEEFKKTLLEQNKKSRMMELFTKYLEKGGNYIFNMRTTSEGKIVKESWLAKWRRQEAPHLITINSIDIPIEYSIKLRGRELEQNRSLLRTRWLFTGSERQVDSVKRDRKRVLFDIEGWQRGWFVPLRHFYSRDSPQ